MFVNDHDEMSIDFMLTDVFIKLFNRVEVFQFSFQGKSINTFFISKLIIIFGKNSV